MTCDAAVRAVAAVDARAAATAADSDDQVGVAVLDRATGRVVAGARGRTPYELASVTKLVTVVDVLHRAEGGKVTVGSSTRSLTSRALRLSDDAAMNSLWVTYGSESTVEDMISLAGLQDASLPRDPGNWGETEMSAVDVTAVYSYALTKLDASDRDFVLGALGAAADTAAYGTDQAFGLLGAPRPAGVAAKQGWQYDGDVFANTTGLLGAGRRYVAAVLTQQPESRRYTGAFAHVDADTATLRSVLRS